MTDLYNKLRQVRPMEPRIDRIWNGITRAARRLRGDRRGAIALFLAFAIIPMIGFVGIATDTARGYLVKSRLSSALDSAALAGGLVMFESTRDADVQMYFNANFPPGYMDATISGPNIDVDDDDETIMLTASATIPTTFMRVFGYETMTVTAMAEVTRQRKGLDVVLAIDMSGSMNSGVAGGGGSRIDAARDAAEDLIEILFGNDDSKDLLNIGLVPWNGKVNVTINDTDFDPDDTTTMAVPAFVNPEDPSPNPASPPPPNPQSQVFFANNSPVPLLEAPPPDWKGAVYNRFIDDGDPNNDADILYGPINLLGADWVAWQPVGPEGEPVPGGALCALSVGPECRPTLSHGITPLQNEKDVILDAVEDLEDPTGVTNIPNGLGWAWRVLKPAPPFTEADPNPDYDRDQAIVLLTDGENFGGSGDGYKATFGLGSNARPDMNDRLLALADNIKADGVILYIIQFSNSGSQLKALLQTVASGPGSPYYHFAPDAAALQQAFREIANNLSQLRLSK